MSLLKSLGLMLFLGANSTSADKAAALTEPGSRDNSNQCSCYVVSGADPGYFQYYRFWDFRDIPNDGSNDFTKAPPLVTPAENSGGQDVTSSFFNTSQFIDDWSLQDGIESAHAASTLKMVNSYQNVFIARDPNTGSTYLGMRALRLPDFVSIAEMDSNQKNVLHASIRTRMRVVPLFSNMSIPFINNGILPEVLDGVNYTHPVPPGAVAGIFTYQSDVQESDIEILTSDPSTNIRYSNQPDTDETTGDAVPDASTNQIMPKDAAWIDYHDHRLDWFDGITRWYVDGDLALEKRINVPTKPSGLVLNVWSDGGIWSGNMSIGAQVVVAIEYIEMTFNVSGKLSSSKKRASQQICGVGCDIDNVRTRGTPVVAFNVTGAESGTGGRNQILAGAIVLHGLPLLWAVLLTA